MKEKIKKIIKYVFIALVIGFFVLSALDTFNVSPSSNAYTVSILDLMFGKTITFSEENILKIKCIPSLTISGILLILAACSLFYDFKKLNKYRGLVIAFITAFSLVTVCTLMRSFAALPDVGTDYNYFSFEKVYKGTIAISILLVLVSLLNLWIDEVNTIDRKVVGIIIAVLLLTPVLSFFIKYVVADYRAQTYVFSGKEIIFGTAWEEEIFGITKTEKDLLSLIHYILALIAFVTAIIDCLVINIDKKRVFGYIALFITLAIGIYYSNLLTNSLSIKYLNSKDVLTSLNVKYGFNFYGKLLVSSVFVAFILEVMTFIKDKNLKEITQFAIPVLLLVVFVSLYCQAFSVMIKSGTVEYSIGYQKGYEAIVEKKFSDHKINSIYLILYYAFVLSTFVTSLVTFKNKRIKYLVLCGLSLVAVVFGLLVPFELYDVVKEHNTYFVKISTVAWLGFVFVLLSCIISFYTAFKFENKKDA